MATEQIRLYGFLISDDHLIRYGVVRSLKFRRIFIRSAVVEGDLADCSQYPF